MKRGWKNVRTGGCGRVFCNCPLLTEWLLHVVTAHKSSGYIHKSGPLTFLYGQSQTQHLMGVGKGYRKGHIYASVV